MRKHYWYLTDEEFEVKRNEIHEENLRVIASTNPALAQRIREGEAGPLPTV